MASVDAVRRRFVAEALNYYFLLVTSEIFGTMPKTLGAWLVSKVVQCNGIFLPKMVCRSRC